MSKHINRNTAAKFLDTRILQMGNLYCKPLLHLYADKEIVVEGANNLDYYDDTNVKISFEKCTLLINGENMQIKCLANRNLSVSGVIKNVGFEYF